MFLESILQNQDGKCAEMLKNDPTLVNQPLYTGATNPICRASWLGYRNIILLLLENGADINQLSSDGRNALIWASAKGDIKTMQLLIERGANKNHEDSEGLNAFDVCVTKQLYEPALLLYKEYGMRPKPIEFYREHSISKHFDFELFF